MTISLFTQDDFSSGVNLLIAGRDQFYVCTGGDRIDIPFWRFYVSVALRILTGILGITVTFLLVVQSDNAVDLLLNFSGTYYFVVNVTLGLVLQKQTTSHLT